MEVIDTKMLTKIAQNDIDRTHIIGKPKTNGKSRPILINLFVITTKKHFFNKKQLKDLAMFLAESWTVFRVKRLRNA